jgi:hypothetical protein
VRRIRRDFLAAEKGSSESALAPELTLRRAPSRSRQQATIVRRTMRSDRHLREDVSSHL